MDASLFTTTGIKGGERHVQQNKNEVNFDAIRPFHNFPGLRAMDVDHCYALSGYQVDFHIPILIVIVFIRQAKDLVRAC